MCSRENEHIKSLFFNMVNIYQERIKVSHWVQDFMAFICGKCVIFPATNADNCDYANCRSARFFADKNYFEPIKIAIFGQL